MTNEDYPTKGEIDLDKFWEDEDGGTLYECEGIDPPFDAVMKANAKARGWDDED